MPRSPRFAPADVHRRPSVVLAVGGTDPLAGAGVIADAIVIAALGVVPLVVESAIVEQDSFGVEAFHPVDIELFRRQLDRALRDGRPDVVKLGMLGSARHVDAVSDALAGVGSRVVADPVLRGGTQDGPSLADEGAIAAMLRMLVALGPRALVTPNAPELGALLGTSAPASLVALADAAAQLASKTGVSVYAKGGHLDPPGTDVFTDGSGVRRFGARRPWPFDVHGTGCRLAASIAARLARGESLGNAVALSKRGMDATARDPRRVARIGLGRPQFVPAGSVPTDSPVPPPASRGGER